MFNALVTTMTLIALGFVAAWWVITMTLIALGFVLAWWVRPDIRDWMEAPKYKFVRWGRERGRNW